MTSTSVNNLTLYRYRRKNKCLHEELAEGITLTLMLIPAGEFLMGAPESESQSDRSERPQHQVKLESFLMGRYPVTQAQWRLVASWPEIERNLKPEPSEFKGDNRPVEQVTWLEAVEFCKRLSAKAKTRKTYRLPSEAEWEYACRAETEMPFHYGEIIRADLANYNAEATYNGSPQGEYRGETTEVGSFPANRWGLCDMHGNVFEWCADDWHNSYKGAYDDGRAWLEKGDINTTKVLRGGSWSYNPEICRSAYRNFLTRVDRGSYIGFRVCCEAPRTLS